MHEGLREARRHRGASRPARGHPESRMRIPLGDSPPRPTGGRWHVLVLCAEDPRGAAAVPRLRERRDSLRVTEGGHRSSRSPRPAPRRAARHRARARGARRPDRAEPAHERDARGDGAGAVPVVVRGLRPGVREGRGPALGPPARPSTRCSPRRSRRRSWREIPAGWEVKTLGEVCHKPQYGYTQSGSERSSWPEVLENHGHQQGSMGQLVLGPALRNHGGGLREVPSPRGRRSYRAYGGPWPSAA